MATKSSANVKTALLRRSTAAVLLAVSLVCVAMVAAHRNPVAATEKPKNPQAAAPQRPPATLGVPSPKNLLIMIRTTLVALHQANITGNYSVLRDLSAPSFREMNSVERLSAAFAGLRANGGDMTPIVLALPTLSQQPIVDQNGMLRVAGSFDTRPNTIVFDLAFQAIAGIWKLNAIAVHVRAPTNVHPSRTEIAPAKRPANKKSAISKPQAPQSK